MINGAVLIHNIDNFYATNMHKSAGVANSPLKNKRAFNFLLILMRKFILCKSSVLQIL